MPTIELKLFANLAAYSPVDADNYAVDEGITIERLIERLGLPPNQAKLIFINGVLSHMSSQLHGGERVGIFPPVGGG